MIAVKQFLENGKKEIEAYLETLFLSPIVPPLLGEAMKYSIMNGGKRVRAILTISAGRMFQGRDENLFPMAAALEFIHAYSLVHDDLPALDNDDFRRGMLSTHKKYGEAMGILTGDALLTYAFWIIASQSKDKDIVSPLVEALSYAAGIGGMVIGQVGDIMAERHSSAEEILGAGKKPEDLLDFIHYNKTAALICVACKGGAIAAQAGLPAISKMEAFGEKIGLAFQIADDILDVVGTREKMGKNVQKDQSHGKLTYPGLWGLEKSKEKADSLIQEACRCVSDIPGHEPLVELAHFIVSRDH